MNEITYNAAAVEALCGFLISNGLERIPWLKDKWSQAGNKPLILFALFEVVTLGWWALACWTPLGVPPTPFACGWAGVAPAMITGGIGFAGTQLGWLTTARKSRNAEERNAQ